jgi:hypothetical protein
LQHLALDSSQAYSLYSSQNSIFVPGKICYATLPNLRKSLPSFPDAEFIRQKRKEGIRQKEPKL